MPIGSANCGTVIFKSNTVLTFSIINPVYLHETNRILFPANPMIKQIS